MKNFMILTALLSSFSAFSADVSRVVEWPLMADRISFSSESDQNGVCRAIGFERAAVGSATFAEKSRMKVVAGADGKIVRGEDHDENLAIDKIICLNPGLKRLESAAIAYGPQYKPYTLETGDEINFSTNSSQDGVCRFLGFEKAAKDGVYSHPTDNLKVVLDSKGKIVGGTSAGGREIMKMICLNTVK